jgi:phosphoribosylformylglycinamidine (FGAM) synthase-like amidotransferase family enzyme
MPGLQTDFLSQKPAFVHSHNYSCTSEHTLRISHAQGSYEKKKVSKYAVQVQEKKMKIHIQYSKEKLEEKRYKTNGGKSRRGH